MLKIDRKYNKIYAAVNNKSFERIIVCSTLAAITYMSINKKKILAIPAMLLTTIIWGISFVVMKNSLDSFMPAQLISLRFAIASLVLALLFIKEWKYFNLKVLFHGFLIGLFTFIAYMFQTYGLNMTTPGKNAFLTTFYCVLVPFVSWAVNKQKPKKKNLISAILGIIGIGLISLDLVGNEFIPNIGDFLTLVCSIFFALQITYQNKFSKDSNLFILSTISTAFIALFSFIFSLIVEGPYPQLQGSMLPSLAFLALGATALCMMLQNFGLKYSNPNEGAIVLSLEAVFGTIASFIAGYEQFDLQKEIGFLVVFAAVFISQFDFSKWQKKKESNTEVKTEETNTDIMDDKNENVTNKGAV